MIEIEAVIIFIIFLNGQFYYTLFTLLLIAGHISHTMGINEGTCIGDSLDGLVGGKTKTPTNEKKYINHNKAVSQS